MNSNRNGWDSTKRAKMPYFIVVPLLRLENIKERWKKIERYIQSMKNIYKLKWLGP